jgi:ribonuclease T2
VSEVKPHVTRMRSALGRSVLLGCLLAIGQGLSFDAFARHKHENRAGTAGLFDYYLLSLSWSPSYCLVHPEDDSQCHRRGYGFVLHGLWPQYENGGYPQDCATSATLTEEAFALGRTIYPSPRLIRHEWQQHGTCSGLDAMRYFRAADAALAVVHIPPLFDAPAMDQHLQVEAIRREFLAANPAMPAEGLSISCSRGELTEVRVCLSRELKLRRCEGRVSSQCDRAPLAIPAAR